jgi:hypothetical protein
MTTIIIKAIVKNIKMTTMIINIIIIIMIIITIMTTITKIIIMSKVPDTIKEVEEEGKRTQSLIQEQ